MKTERSGEIRVASLPPELLELVKGGDLTAIDDYFEERRQTMKEMLREVTQ